MSNDTANTIVVVAAVAALVSVAIAALIAAIALWRARARRATCHRLARCKSTWCVARRIATDFEGTSSDSTNLNRLSDELGPRLLRVDLLLDETEATIQSVRATAETAEDIVRGPAAAMDRQSARPAPPAARSPAALIGCAGCQRPNGTWR